MNSHMESNTHEQDKVTESLSSSTDIALPNMSQAHVSNIVAATQSDDLELRGKVYNMHILFIYSVLIPYS